MRCQWLYLITPSMWLRNIQCVYVCTVVCHTSMLHTSYGKGDRFVQSVLCCQTSKKSSYSANSIRIKQNILSRHQQKFISVSNNYLDSAAIASSRRHNQFCASLNTNRYKFSSGRLLAFFFCHDSPALWYGVHVPFL